MNPFLSGRLLAAVWAGKVTRLGMRTLGSGGTALPGLVAERVDPLVAARLALPLAASALVSGTNGKTTSAAMLARILRADGRLVLHNRSGSNLLRGVTAMLLDAASPFARLPNAATAVLEADEAALPAIAAAAPPSVAVFTNLMRDQLDRYGEIEAIALRWAAALPSFPPACTLALNVDDPLIASLEQHWQGRTLRFGIEDPDIPPAPAGEIMDAVWDPASGDAFTYDRRYFAQLGRWRTASGRVRPTPHVAADQIAETEAGMSFRLRLPAGDAAINLPADGLYSVYNALAAAAAAAALDVAPAAIASALADHEAAFGRQEELTVQGRPVRLLLGKNPSGLNQALRTLQRGTARHHLLVLLNDGIADGTDVSWIWDVDWEAQAPYCASLTVGGRRAADLALRLEYAGFPPPHPAADGNETDIGAVLQQALQSGPPNEPLVILPTYTALLDVRRRLGQLGATALWEAAS